MLVFVVRSMKEDLYIELMEGLKFEKGHVDDDMTEEEWRRAAGL